MVAMALWCAITLCRIDVLYALIAFPLLRVINSTILLKTFWSEIVRGERTTEWFSVKRYSEQTAEATLSMPEAP